MWPPAAHPSRYLLGRMGYVAYDTAWRVHFAYMRDVSYSGKSNRDSCCLSKVFTTVDGSVGEYVFEGLSESGR